MDKPTKEPALFAYLRCQVNGRVFEDSGDPQEVAARFDAWLKQILGKKAGE